MGWRRDGPGGSYRRAHEGGRTLADEGAPGRGDETEGRRPPTARPTARPSASAGDLRRPAASSRPAASRPAPRATGAAAGAGAAPTGAARATNEEPAETASARRPTTAPEVETEGFDRSEKFLFLGGAALVVVIAVYGLFMLLSAGNDRSTSVNAGASNVTTTTRAPGSGAASPTSTATDTTDTTTTDPDTTDTTDAPATDTTVAPAPPTGGGGSPTTTAAPTTTLPGGVRPLVQVAPRSGDRLVIPNNSDPGNVNPGVTAGQIKIRNLGSSPAQFYVTLPTGSPEEILKALRIRVLQPSPGTPGLLPGGGDAAVVVILQANPVNDQGTPIGPAQPGDTGTIIIKGLGADIPISYVVG